VRQAFGNGGGGAVILVIGLGPGGAEDRHGRADLGHALEGVHKLGHDAEDAPGIFVDKSGVVAHG